MSFSKYLKAATVKASAKNGNIYAKLTSKNFNVDVANRLFECYSMPVFRYGLPVYLTSCSKSSLNNASSVLTKYLTRYLGISYKSSDDIANFLTETCPLEEQLKQEYKKSCEGLEKQLKATLPNYTFTLTRKCLKLTMRILI